jgi:hypothetical protein
MIKKVLCKAGIHMDTALATLGWLSFFGSFLINDPILIILLKTIARVLP